jgi:lipid A 3-O-deacylase
VHPEERKTEGTQVAEPVWALAVVAIGLADMQANYCDTGCLARRAAQPGLSVSAGRVIFRDEPESTEVYIRRDTSLAFGPFGLSYGLSVTDRGDVWAGAGVVHRVTLPGGRTYLETHFMPGIYLRGEGADLGGPINARAGAEFGWEEMDSGLRIGLSIDHRSHGGIFDLNPGAETVQLRVSFPTR